MKKGDLFPLADNPSYDMRFNSMSNKFLGWGTAKNLRARYTGEKRSPQKGEWYISGAIPEAYEAKNDLTNVYHIAEIVLCNVKTVTYEEVEVMEVIPNRKDLQ